MIESIAIKRLNFFSYIFCLNRFEKEKNRLRTCYEKTYFSWNIKLFFRAPKYEKKLLILRLSDFSPRTDIEQTQNGPTFKRMWTRKGWILNEYTLGQTFKWIYHLWMNPFGDCPMSVCDTSWFSIFWNSRNACPCAPQKELMMCFSQES